MLGKWGERYVAEDLRKRGWMIRAVNYRCRMGEIDIIAQKGKYLSFVEVKLRKSDSYGQAREAVTAEKQRKLRTTAELYLQENPTKLQPRFDVAEIYAPQGMNPETIRISYVEDAF